MGKSKLKEPLASRELAGHSRVAAAQLLGVHIRTWQAWEKGRSPMPSQWLQLYRHLAGVERIPFRSSAYPRPEVSLMTLIIDRPRRPGGHLRRRVRATLPLRRLQAGA
jgi:hypothetical protein